MKKRIEFFHEIKGVAELFPIIEAKDYKPNWTKKAKEDYLQNKNKVWASSGGLVPYLTLGKL